MVYNLKYTLYDGNKQIIQTNYFMKSELDNIF